MKIIQRPGCVCVVMVGRDGTPIRRALCGVHAEDKESGFAELNRLVSEVEEKRREHA